MPQVREFRARLGVDGETFFTAGYVINAILPEGQRLTIWAEYHLRVNEFAVIRCFNLDERLTGLNIIDCRDLYITTWGRRGFDCLDNRVLPVIGEIRRCRVGILRHRFR